MTHTHTQGHLGKQGQCHLHKVCMRNGEALEFLKPHAPLSSDLEKSLLARCMWERSHLASMRMMTKMTSLQTQRRHKVPDMNDSFCPRAAGFQERVQQYSGQDRPALRVKQSDEEKSSFADVARCLGWEMPTSRSRMVLRNYRQHQKRRCSMHRKPRADSIHVPRSRQKLDNFEMYEGLCFRKSWPVKSK